MARIGADAFGDRGDLRIDRGLAHPLRLRVSQLNNCTYCLNLHYEAAREAIIPRGQDRHPDRVALTELHSEAQQAALRYTEALTRAADTDPDAAFQHVYDALAKHFDCGSRGRLVHTVATAFASSQTEHGRQESSRVALSHTLCTGGDDPASARATRRSDRAIALRSNQPGSRH